MAKRLAPLLAVAAAVAGLFALALVVFAPARADEADRGFLANLISQALSSPSTNVSVGAVSGVLTSDVSISGIVLSDREGPWLKVDNVRLVWSRLALLRRRLEVNQLTIGHLEVLRRPLPSETPPPETGAKQPILPELPVKVIIGQFGIDQLSLAEPVIGVAAQLNLSGKATLGPPSEGLDLALTSRRLDAPGEFKALMSYVPATDKLMSASTPKSRRAASSLISSTFRASRRRSSASKVPDRSTISTPSSTSPPARTCGRAATSRSPGRARRASSR